MEGVFGAQSLGLQPWKQALHELRTHPHRHNVRVLQGILEHAQTLARGDASVPQTLVNMLDEAVCNHIVDTPEAAERLIDDLERQETAEALLTLGAMQGHGINGPGGRWDASRAADGGPQPSTSGRSGSQSMGRGRSGMSASASRPKGPESWQNLILDIFAHPRMDFEDLHPKLKHAAHLSKQNVFTRGTLIPLQLQEITDSVSTSQEAVVALRTFVSLWSQPTFRPCSACHKQRLIKVPGSDPSDPEFFVCGSGSTLFQDRSCRMVAEDVEDDFAIIFPEALRLAVQQQQQSRNVAGPQPQGRSGFSPTGHEQPRVEKRPAEQQHVGPIKLARMDGGHVLTVYRDQYGQEHQVGYAPRLQPQALPSQSQGHGMQGAPAQMSYHNQQQQGSTQGHSQELQVGSGQQQHQQQPQHIIPIQPGQLVPIHGPQQSAEGEEMVAVQIMPSDGGPSQTVLMNPMQMTQMQGYAQALPHEHHMQQQQQQAPQGPVFVNGGPQQMTQMSHGLPPRPRASGSAPQMAMGWQRGPSGQVPVEVLNPATGQTSIVFMSPVDPHGAPQVGMNEGPGGPSLGHMMQQQQQQGQQYAPGPMQPSNQQGQQVARPMMLGQTMSQPPPGQACEGGPPPGTKYMVLPGGQLALVAAISGPAGAPLAQPSPLPTAPSTSSGSQQRGMRMAPQPASAPQQAPPLQLQVMSQGGGPLPALRPHGQQLIGAPAQGAGQQNPQPVVLLPNGQMAMLAAEPPPPLHSQQHIQQQQQQPNVLMASRAQRAASGQNGLSVSQHSGPMQEPEPSAGPAVSNRPQAGVLKLGSTGGPRQPPHSLAAGVKDEPGEGGANLGADALGDSSTDTQEAIMLTNLVPSVYVVSGDMTDDGTAEQLPLQVMPDGSSVVLDSRGKTVSKPPSMPPATLKAPRGARNRLNLPGPGCRYGVMRSANGKYMHLVLQPLSAMGMGDAPGAPTPAVPAGPAPAPSEPLAGKGLAPPPPSTMTAHAPLTLSLGQAQPSAPPLTGPAQAPPLALTLGPVSASSAPLLSVAMPAQCAPSQSHSAPGPGTAPVLSLAPLAKANAGPLPAAALVTGQGAAVPAASAPALVLAPIPAAPPIGALAAAVLGPAAEPMPEAPAPMFGPANAPAAQVRSGASAGRVSTFRSGGGTEEQADKGRQQSGIPATGADAAQPAGKQPHNSSSPVSNREAKSMIEDDEKVDQEVTRIYLQTVIGGNADVGRTKPGYQTDMPSLQQAPAFARRPQFLRRHPAEAGEVMVEWTARAITRTFAMEELELFCVAGELPQNIVEHLPKTLVVSDFKPRKEIPVVNMKGKPHVVWMSPDTYPHQVNALKQLSDVRVGSVIHINSEYDFVMSPQWIEETIVLVAVLLDKTEKQESTPKASKQVAPATCVASGGSTLSSAAGVTGAVQQQLAGSAGGDAAAAARPAGKAVASQGVGSQQAAAAGGGGGAGSGGAAGSPALGAATASPAGGAQGTPAGTSPVKEGRVVAPEPKPAAALASLPEAIISQTSAAGVSADGGVAAGAAAATATAGTIIPMPFGKEASAAAADIAAPGTSSADKPLPGATSMMVD